MNERPLLEQTLCLKFCAYYKPGKDEALACRGFLVVAQLQQQGMAIPFDRYGQDPDRGRGEALIRGLCMACAFHEQDCDFMQDRSARPCGGYVLLSQLLADGRIMLEDIKGE